jgi:hypothetical protein
MQAIPQPNEEVSFQREGVEIARLHGARDLQRPFVFPLIGPSGRSLTRMGHPHDPVTHSHHNSVWFAHQSVNGLNFWEDTRGGRIVQQRINRLDDSDLSAAVETVNAWITKDGTTLLDEQRRMTVQWLEHGEWLLFIDAQFEAHAGDVTFDQSWFGLIGVRMAKTIGVNDGGGTIRNSEGGIDEVGCFRKPARWVDYAGPITTTTSEGITLMDHPMNLHHPVAFHVRNDGWMGATLSAPGAVVVKPGAPLRVRYGLYVHSGIPAAPQIEERWVEFAHSTFQQFQTKR